MSSEDMFLNGKSRDILIDINNKKDLVHFEPNFFYYINKLRSNKTTFIQSNLYYF